MHNKAMALMKLKSSLTKKTPKEISEYIDEFKGPDVEPDMEHELGYMEKVDPTEIAADNLMSDKDLKKLKTRK